MSDQIFQEAYGRVRSRHTDQEWFSLTPQQITDAIYREMRVIDQQRVDAAIEGGSSRAADRSLRLSIAAE